jgi:hypothetical protein
MVCVDLFEARKHSIHIYLTKNGNSSSYGFPKTDEYTIVKASSKQIFDQAYSTFLRTAHQCNVAKGEYYLMKRNDGHPNGMAWYSEATESKMGLQIQFYDHPKDFSLTIEHIKTWQGVQHFRRAGNIIKGEQFHLFFKAALNFLHDANNYSSNFRKLVIDFKEILHGREVQINKDENWALGNSIASVQIKDRISSIEKRLIEVDNDAPDERMKLRGELEGLKFAYI